MNGIKTVGKHVGKLLAINRTCLYSRQLFHQLFRVGKLVFDVWTIGKRVLVIANQSKHALYWRDWRDFTKCRTKVQFDPCATWNLFKAAASYWTSVLYALREGFLLIYRFVQTFIFLHYFHFRLWWPRHNRQLCVSATALRRPYCKLALLSLTCEGTSLLTFWSLSTRVCQLKFAVWGRFIEQTVALWWLYWLPYTDSVRV